MCSIIQWYTKRKPFDSLVKWLPTARPLNSSHFNLFWGSGGLHYKKTQFVFASSLMANMSVLTNTSTDRSSSRKYQWSYLFMVAQVSLLLTVVLLYSEVFCFCFVWVHQRKLCWNGRTSQLCKRDAAVSISAGDFDQHHAFHSASVGNELRLHANSVILFSTDIKGDFPKVDRRGMIEMLQWHSLTLHNLKCIHLWMDGFFYSLGGTFYHVASLYRCTTETITVMLNKEIINQLSLVH